MVLTEDVAKPLEAHIRPISAVYSDLKEKNGLEVSYVRMPIADERSPGLREFDGLVEVLKAVDAATAVYFNCQMGKGRTTTGTYAPIALTIYKSIIKIKERKKIQINIT
jgi:protein-tyrosine phosphatase